MKSIKKQKTLFAYFCCIALASRLFVITNYKAVHIRDTLTPPCSVKGMIKMLTKAQLEKLSLADFSSCDKNDLADIKNISVNVRQPLIKRTDEYLNSVKNPYLFRVNDTAVKVNFTGDKSLEELASGIFSSYYNR